MDVFSSWKPQKAAVQTRCLNCWMRAPALNSSMWCGHFDVEASFEIMEVWHQKVAIQSLTFVFAHVCCCVSVRELRTEKRRLFVPQKTGMWTVRGYCSMLELTLRPEAMYDSVAICCEQFLLVRCV